MHVNIIIINKKIDFEFEKININFHGLGVYFDRIMEVNNRFLVYKPEDSIEKNYIS